MILLKFNPIFCVRTEASGGEACDDGSFYGSDAEWFEGSASDDNISDAAPSGDEKECLL
jgi:hypothetical protein